MLIKKMAKSDALIKDIIDLLKQESEYYNPAEYGNVKSIIAGALQGLGMVTSTWKETAQIKANSTIYNVDAQRKLSPLEIVGIITAGIVVFAIWANVVIKTAN